MSLSKPLNQQSPPPPPPPPELPDLCLLALFSQMTTLDLLHAHQVCPQWYHRVRELNAATTTSLTIAIVADNSSGKGSLKSIQRRINECFFGRVFAKYRPTADNHHHHADLSEDTSLLLYSRQSHRQTLWNTLALTEEHLKSATVRKQLATAFAGLTALTFVRPF
ncbi:hypothetical protein TYRP_011791 [Tyrophagus putrescentiae]|nr:hypothetical protein TYRP_011791 [Tyrophagus putrescentiae]